MENSYLNTAEIKSNFIESDRLIKQIRKDLEGARDYATYLKKIIEYLQKNEIDNFLEETVEMQQLSKKQLRL